MFNSCPTRKLIKGVSFLRFALFICKVHVHVCDSKDRRGRRGGGEEEREGRRRGRGVEGGRGGRESGDEGKKNEVSIHTKPTNLHG